MAWHDIPKVKVLFLLDENGKKKGVQLSAQDFEQVMGKLEDFYDFRIVDEVKKRNEPTYSFEEVGQRLGFNR